MVLVCEGWVVGFKRLRWGLKEGSQGRVAASGGGWAVVLLPASLGSKKIAFLELPTSSFVSVMAAYWDEILPAVNK